VRSFLIAAFVVFLIVTSLVYVFRRPIRARLKGRGPAITAPPAPPDPAPGPLPDVLRRVQTLQHAPEAQRLLADLVRDCANRGVAAVSELRARLRDEPDVELETRWTFVDGRVRGFPTLRSAYLAALLEIPGPEAHDALLEALSTTSSPDEAYQIAGGLERRGEGGFTTAAFDVATKAGAGHAEVAGDLVALVTRADPEGAATEVVARSPRADDGTDPALLAQVLEILPSDSAVATARGLLTDPEVTRKGKERYLRSLCDRGEGEIFRSLGDMAAEGLIDDDLEVKMAYSAIGSRAFYVDQGAYAAAGDAGSRAKIRERYMRRIEEVEMLVEAVRPADPAARPVLLDSLRRRLAEQRARLKD